MSGSGLPYTDTTGIIDALQAGNRLLSAILAQFRTGLTVNTSLASYTVAALPATAPLGVMAYASNGRANASQGAGAGTGTLVIGNGAVWNAVWSGVAVTA